jgi:hypothetical protein
MNKPDELAQESRERHRHSSPATTTGWAAGTSCSSPQLFSEERLFFFYRKKNQHQLKLNFNKQTWLPRWNSSQASCCPKKN